MRTAGPQCDPAAATCTCARLPKLAPPRPGGRLALVRVGSEYLVLGRDPNYGDLVAATPTQPTTAGGSAGGAEFGPGVGVTSTGVSVAGVPVGPVVADPTGPRGGVAAPGADVGRFVAAVGFETHASVIAHDASAGQLEYLELRPVARVVGGVASSAWVTSNSHAIDTERDSGFGASLVAGPEGALHAAWFARRADGVESLRYATAVAPSSVLDWQRAVIVSEPTIGATGCEGCSPLQVCVQGDSDPECAIPSLVPTCDPTCDRRSLCVQGACRRVVRPGTGRPFLDRPGSSTTIAMRAGGLLLAWYDRHAGALRLGSGAPGVDFTHAIVDGGKGDDVGRLARLDWRPTTSSSPSSTATRPATGCGCCTEVPSTR